MKTKLPVLFLISSLAAAGCGDDSGSTPNQTGKCMDLCSDGAKECSENNVMVCEVNDEGCTQWSVKEECGDRHCDSASFECTDECSETCSKDHPLKCSDEGVMECKSDESGCARWELKEACGDGRHCDSVSFECADECSETCGEEHVLKCSEEGILECTSDESGCAKWEVKEACGDGMHCDSDKLECVNGCSETCSDDHPLKCSEEGVMECKSDESGCAKWELKETCGEDQKCDSSEFKCIECKQACDEPAKKCTDDGNGVSVCTINENGCAVWTETACTGGQVCDPAKFECVERCRIGDVRCSGKSVETCKEVDGKADWTQQACPEGQYCSESTHKCEFACGNDCEPFSIVFLPDTQGYSRPVKFNADGTIVSKDLKNNRYLSQTKWIRDNKDKYNIRFALHLGDITNFNVEDEWKVASAAHEVLDKANIPYLISTGNHDYVGYKYDKDAKKHLTWYSDGVYSRSRSHFSKYFNNTRYKDKKWFGEYNDGANSYATFNVGGLKFLAISLEFSPRKDIICWADDLIKKYPDHYVIITTHSYLSRNGKDNKRNYSGGATLSCTSNGASGSALARELTKRHSNVILVASGHICGAEFQKEPGYAGNEFYEMLVDYQCESVIASGGSKERSCGIGANGWYGSNEGGNGWLRVLTIDPKKIKDNGLSRSFTPLGNDQFYDKTKEFYCSSLYNWPDKGTADLYKKEPTDSKLASYDKFQNNHNFTFSMDLSVPANGKYADDDHSFDPRIANANEKGVQSEPAIGMNREIGSFVVVWRDDSSDEDGKDSKGNPNYDIAGRLFYSGGCAKGKQFIINDTTKGNQLSPDVAMDKNDNFVVVWMDDSDGNGAGQILMRGFDAEGKQRFKTTTVNTVADGDQQHPVVAMNPDGQFVVAWEDGSEIAGKMQVFVRGFKADGSELFKQFNVSGAPKGVRNQPDIAMAADGSFVVTWADDSDGNGGYQVAARAFKADGTPKGAVFEVNTQASNQQFKPSIDMNNKGDYFIAYQDDSEESGRYVVKARGFRSGSFDNSNALFNDQVVAYSSKWPFTSPKVCVDGNGNAALGWFGKTTRTNSGKEFESPDVQRKTIKLNKGSYVVSSVAKVNYIGYAENNSNKADKTPDIACSESGRNVYVWTEKLDQGKVSEIFARGYDSI